MLHQTFDCSLFMVGIFAICLFVVIDSWTVTIDSWICELGISLCFRCSIWWIVFYKYLQIFLVQNIEIFLVLLFLLCKQSFLLTKKLNNCCHEMYKGLKNLQNTNLHFRRKRRMKQMKKQIVSLGFPKNLTVAINDCIFF